MTVESAGFKQLNRTDITVNVAQTITVNVRLQVGGGEQSVTVDGSGINVNTTDATVSTVIDQKFIENIPLNGRTLQSLLTAIPGVTIAPTYVGGQPGVSGEMSVNGMRTEANYYTVDGASSNTGANRYEIGFGGSYSGATPAQTVLGTTQSLISLDALQELRASTSTYSAEYGRTPGGQFTFTSRSGTNEWHGSMYDYFRNDVFDSNDWFSRHANIRKPSTRQNDFGGTFSGPIHIPGIYNGRNKSFFFLAYEGLRLLAPQTAITADVPGRTMRTTAPSVLQPFLNAFPVSTAAEDPTTGLSRYVAGFSNPSSLNSLSVRGDHSLSDRIKFFGRYSWAPSNNTSRSGNNLANQVMSSGRSHSGTAGLTWVIRPSVVNDLRFNSTYTSFFWHTAVDSFGGATAPGGINLPGFTGNPTDNFEMYFGFGTYPNVVFQYMTSEQNQTNIVDSMTASIGRHNLKWGIDYRRIHTDTPFIPTYEFTFFSAPTQIYNGTSSTSFQKQTGTASPIYWNLAAYFQDEWKVNSRLSLSTGIRWDLNPAPKDAHGNDPYTVTQISDLATTVLAPRGTRLWNTAYGNFSPRFGLAYQLNQQPGHELVVRTGFGTFFDLGSVNGSSGYYAIGFYAATSQPIFHMPQNIIDNLKVDLTPPYNWSVFALDPNLKSPYSWQWNTSLEQGLGKHRTLTVGYVASLGRKLLSNKNVDPSLYGNTAFSEGYGLGITRNLSSSNYNALQLSYQQTVSHGLQLLGSYTWAHSIDDATTNFTIANLQRANSDIDIRHNAQLSLSYDVPGLGSGFEKRLTHNWGLDSRVSLRTATPVDIISPTQLISNGSRYNPHPNRVPNESLYIYDNSLPGGRRINYAAFAPAYDGTTPIEGDAGRNAARGFGSAQTDLALRREFTLRDRFGAQLRVEAFNVFNHANFGGIYNNLGNGADLFGRAYNLQSSQLNGLNSLYQLGGPRSMQFSLKLHF